MNDYVSTWLGMVLTVPLTPGTRTAWRLLAMGRGVLARGVLARGCSPCLVDQLAYYSGWSL